MRRAGHAILSGGGVWLIDPPDGDGVDRAVAELGRPAGVLQLLDRHPRDCETIAARLGVPLHRVPLGDIPGAPFEVLPIWHLPAWKEDALWFPRERILVVAEALVGESGYTAPGERVGVHPMRRLLPPADLRRFDVQTLLLGHGPAFHGTAARSAVDDALDGSRRRIPQLALAQMRRALRSLHR